MSTRVLWDVLSAPVIILQNELNGLADSASTVYGPEQGGASSPQLGFASIHIDTQSNTYTDSSELWLMLISSMSFNAGGAYPSLTPGFGYKLAFQNYRPVIVNLQPGAHVAVAVDENIGPFIVPPGFWKPVLVNMSGFPLPPTNACTVTLRSAATINQ